MTYDTLYKLIIVQKCKKKKKKKHADPTRSGSGSTSLFRIELVTKLFLQKFIIS